MTPGPKSLARLRKLVGMLKSPFEPEAESAQAAIDRWLTKHGKTLADLESLLEVARPAPAPSRITEAELLTGWAASAAEYRQRRRRFAVDTEDDEDEDEEARPPVDRDRVLREVNEPGANISEIARRYGLNPSTVMYWRKRQPGAVPKFKRRTPEEIAADRKAAEGRRRRRRKRGGDLLGERLGFRDRVAAGEQ